jgi:molybdate transport system substrate-binding protein
MRTGLVVITVCAAAALPSAPIAPSANAAEIKVLSATGIREAIEDLAPKFERSTDHKLVVAFANSGTVLKRLGEGEAADVIILPREAVDGLVKDGKANASSVAIIARAGIGVAIRKGAIKPDISTPDAFKRALLAAKSVTYLDPAGGGISGVHVSKLLDRLGIANELKPKTLFHRNAAEAAAQIVDGKAEIGMNLIPELTPITGIEVVGPLPGDLQHTIVYSTAINSNAKEPAASKAFADYLRSPAAALVVKAKGMDPG